MPRNRRPLSAERSQSSSQSSSQSHLPVSGLIRRRMKTLFAMLVGLLVFQVTVMWTVEDLTLLESVWITMTTVSTVGYGDYAPQTLIGRLSTIIVLFIGAMTLLTLIISDFIEYRFYRRERILRGLWVYKMKGHIVIINTPQHGGEPYFMRFASQIRSNPGYETVPIMLLTRQFPNGLPPELTDMGLVHFHGTGSDPSALQAVHAGSARHIVVLTTDENDANADSITFDIAYRLSELNMGYQTTSECVADRNRSRLKALGIRAVIRPIRTYPEIMVRAVVAPGSEKVLEDLFNYEHDHPQRYDFLLEDLNWADIVSALIRHDIGTALAYIDDDGEVICQPPIKEPIKGKGLIVLVRSSDTPGLDVVKEALERYRKFLEKWRNGQEIDSTDS